MILVSQNIQITLCIMIFVFLDYEVAKFSNDPYILEYTDSFVYNVCNIICNIVVSVILFNIIQGIHSEIPKGSREPEEFAGHAPSKLVPVISNSERLKCSLSLSLSLSLFPGTLR